jgi:hypothetical protein
MAARTRRTVKAPIGTVRVVGVTVCCETAQHYFAMHVAQIGRYTDHDGVFETVYCEHCQQRHTLTWPENVR